MGRTQVISQPSERSSRAIFAPCGFSRRRFFLVITIFSPDRPNGLHSAYSGDCACRPYRVSWTAFSPREGPVRFSPLVDLLADAGFYMMSVPGPNSPCIHDALF